MMIRNMFADDINRKINGVIKVDQAADDVIEQELNEYVITRELKKHFITFFNYYGDAFDQPTADMGVWISGFFGSGKSHFLKMLSYLLENKEVKGIRSVNIIVGDFTYIADSDFESHVSHLYEWNDDKLIIGKFCQIAAGVEFVMNGANHQMNAVSTFPFYTLEGWEMLPPAKTDMPLKGDTVIENDVWIGQNSVILPGVHIGDGAIIGANSVVGSDVPPYTKVVGNPARAIQKRFDDELIELLLRFKWWDRSIDEINRLIPILTCSDLDKVKAEIKKQLG